MITVLIENIFFQQDKPYCEDRNWRFEMCFRNCLINRNGDPHAHPTFLFATSFYVRISKQKFFKINQIVSLNYKKKFGNCITFSNLWYKYSVKIRVYVCSKTSLSYNKKAKWILPKFIVPKMFPLFCSGFSHIIFQLKMFRKICFPKSTNYIQLTTNWKLPLILKIQAFLLPPIKKNTYTNKKKKNNIVKPIPFSLRWKCKKMGFLSFDFLVLRIFNY